MLQMTGFRQNIVNKIESYH